MVSAACLPKDYSSNPIAEAQSRDAQATSGTLGLQFHVLYASTERDFSTVFQSNLTQLRAGALVANSSGPAD